MKKVDKSLEKGVDFVAMLMFIVGVMNNNPKDEAIAEAKYLAKDYWYRNSSTDGASVGMIEYFRDAPGVQASVEEGSSLEDAVSDYMSSRFETVAWNYKMSSDELARLVFEHLFQ